MYRKSRGFLGLDPVEKKFKVLAEAYPFCSASHHEILTLGTGEISWKEKNIDCPSYEYSMCEGICINGFLYYLVEAFEHTPGNVVQFDLRSEEFRFVVAECFSDLETTKLVNYKGKLGGINCSYGEAGGKYTLKLRLCVLEDVERHEWSTYVYTLPENDLIDDPSNVSIAGVIATGEIVLVMDYTCKPYYVFISTRKRTLCKVLKSKVLELSLKRLSIVVELLPLWTMLSIWMLRILSIVKPSIPAPAVKDVYKILTLLIQRNSGQASLVIKASISAPTVKDVFNIFRR
ncbi:hypothetical protein AALP_AA5G184800 [Arabis alpina]|uniref:F-box associated beta-propeller type 3 domain-containing protein n=1 Tax=Arabis alpina TaxID=50452 RepID=A0A087GXX6_ARAAL|nr:hypothetical protein AALP_AA5G184800 [Arabis alpina]